MASIDALLEAYRATISLPWDGTRTGAERVWFAVYEPAQERRLRCRVPEFELATKQAGHGWKQIDLTNDFAEWMAVNEYREEYFRQPELMEYELSYFADYVRDHVRKELTAPGVDQNTVVTIIGLASLFGFMRASALLEKVTSDIRGRLLVFFPGQHEGHNYRLLNARDGWNYLAIPITGKDKA
jgi:hypothetical protein